MRQTQHRLMPPPPVHDHVPHALRILLQRKLLCTYNDQKRRWMMSMFAAGLAKSATRKEEEQQQQQQQQRLCQGHNPHQIINHQSFDNGSVASTTTSKCREALPPQHPEEDPLLSVPDSSSNSSVDGITSGNVSGQEKGTTARGRAAVGGRVWGRGFGGTTPWDGGGDSLDLEGEGDEDAFLVEWSEGLDFDRQEHAALRKKA